MYKNKLKKNQNMEQIKNIFHYFWLHSKLYIIF